MHVLHILFSAYFSMEVFYTVLSLQPGASPQEIRAAYKRLALKYHPDKTLCDTSAQFLEIREAYEMLTSERNLKYIGVLSDPESIRVVNDILDQYLGRWSEHRDTAIVSETPSGTVYIIVLSIYVSM